MLGATIRAWLLTVLACPLAMPAPVVAHDDDECRIKEVSYISPLSAAAGSYTPPRVPAAQAVTITIALRTRHGGTCRGSIAFGRPTLPAAMLPLGGGSGRLPYTIQSSASGGRQLIFTGPDPDGNRLDFVVSGHIHTVTVTVYVLMQPGATVIPSGSYADHSLALHVFTRRDWNLKLVASRAFTVTGFVESVCQLPPPDVASLSFNSAISQGLPNPAIVFTATFRNVSCTAPARIRLSGRRLQPTSTVTPVANFDNFIHWQARANFGAATVQLDTGTSVEATSPLQNVAHGGTSGAIITIDVNLLKGQRLIAGTYTGILTVTVDPRL